MRLRHLVMAALALVLIVAGTCAQAEMYRVQFDARTWTWYQNPTDPTPTKGINFWIEVFDSEFKNPPDFVGSIVVQAPNGDTVDITTVKHWLPYDKGYSATLKEIDLPSQTILPGKYTVTVIDKSEPPVKILAYDTLLKPLKYLDPPIITNPIAGATDIAEDLDIKWNVVAGAHRYRIMLWNDSWNEPVFWSWADYIYTNKNHFAVPKGALKPNCNYRVRINARADLQETDSHSNSKWVYFKTGAW